MDSVPKTVRVGPWVKAMGLQKPHIVKWLRKQNPTWTMDRNAQWAIKTADPTYLICEGGTDTIEWGKQFAHELGVDNFTRKR